MIPVMQSIVQAEGRADGHDADGRPGNCLQAVVASLLEVPLDAVPHFAETAQRNDPDHPEVNHWWDLMQSWLAAWSRGRLRWDFADAPTFPFAPAINLGSRLILASGPSPRGSFWHIVIMDAETGSLVHDPHPSGAGLVRVEDCFYLTGSGAE